MQLLKIETTAHGYVSMARTYQHNLSLYSKGQHTLENNINTLPEKLNAKKRINDLLVVYHGRTNTLPNEMIHITLGCAMHFHGHQNKVVPLLKPFYTCES
jgi:hypothetical protein